MYVHIDYNSGEPISRQVVAQIKWMIVSGSLSAGEKLPSIRELARQLKINPTTVTRIYGELSQNGIITLRQGQGAFVSRQKPAVARREVRRIVAGKAREMLVEGMRLGLDKTAIDAIVNEEFRKIRTSRDE
jgi:GntR family transcriptional regulator